MTIQLAEKENPVLPAWAQTPAPSSTRKRKWLTNLFCLALGYYLATAIAIPPSWPLGTWNSWKSDAVSQWLSSSSLKGGSSLPHDHQVDIYKHPLGQLIEIQCWNSTQSDPAGIHCYRLPAPLDYTNTSDVRRASIAIVKYQAGGGKTPREDVVGSLIFNFGGPGGAGVEWMRSFSKMRNATGAQYWDDYFEGRYDIVSFDPRGVQKTWPRANCIQDEEVQTLTDVFSTGADLYHASSGALPRQIADANWLSQLCQNNLGEELRHVTTAAVVKDLRLMYKAFGEDALQYAGFSYGTALGAYFADMYPEEVGRLWLDGVVDSRNYQSGDWDNNIKSLEDVLKGFFSSCAHAGEKHCAYAKVLSGEDKATGVSVQHQAAVLESKFYNHLESLKAQPQVILDSDVPQVATYGQFKYSMFKRAYAPGSWPEYAEQLANGFLHGNWSGFYDTYGLTRYEAPFNKNFTSPHAQEAISCADALRHSESWDAKTLEQQIFKLEQDSPYGGEIWVGDGAMCLSAWKIRGKDVWKGNFTSRTAYPVLWGSQQFDPVTPLASARIMKKSFPGSELFRVDGGLGHCTISMPSKCANRVVVDYFVHGKLPSDHPEELDERGEKVCTPDRPPFIPKDEDQEDLNAEEMKDSKIQEVHQGLAEHFFDHMHFKGFKW